jgi:predicted  nucleic acid-binding Zn-ribbon protein
VRCGAIYQDNDASILRGCGHCGSVFFLYFKNAQQAAQLAKFKKELEKKEISLEKELSKRIELKRKKVKEKVKPKRKEKFGIETIRIPREGVYEINIKGLMQNKPLIVLEKGKIYLIHLPSIFEKVSKESESEETIFTYPFF